MHNKENDELQQKKDVDLKKRFANCTKVDYITNSEIKGNVWLCSKSL